MLYFRVVSGKYSQFSLWLFLPGIYAPKQNKRCNKMKFDLVTRLLSLVMVLLVSMPGTAARGNIDPELLKGLSARAIGPAGVGGRISAIDAVASDPNRIVIGAATGGVWISNSGGLTWEAVFDEEAVASIGALAINQSNPDIIWVGTGESNVRNSTSIGAASTNLSMEENPGA